MDKRSLESPTSLAKKRIKKPIPPLQNDELIKPIKRSHKTTYFFGPVNNLTSGKPKQKEPPQAPNGTSKRIISRKSTQKPELQEKEKEQINIIDIESEPSDIPDGEETPPKSHQTPKKSHQTPKKSQETDRQYPTEHSDKAEHTSDLLPVHQSSDDSFEGIRWRASPRRRVIGDRLPSSPLKNVTSPVFLPSDPGRTINEHTNAVLSKYGNDFHNFASQTTPVLSRTHSDISSSESKNKRNDHQKSPTLMRAKSLGLDNLPSSKSSRFGRSEKIKQHPSIPAVNTLNTWIDRFELTSSYSEKTTESTPKKENKEQSEPTKSEIRKETTPVPNGLGMHTLKEESDSNDGFSSDAEFQIKRDARASEDPFSDDDSEVLAALATQKMNEIEKEDTNVDFLNNIKTEGQVSDDPFSDDNLEEVKDAQGEESDDPFTDDDSELVELLGLPKSQTANRPSEENKKTSPMSFKSSYPVLSGVVHSSPIHKHQNSSQILRDSVHAKSFQKSIVKFEKLQLNKVSFDDDRDDLQLSYERSDLNRYQIKSIVEKSYGPNLSRKQLLFEVLDSTQSIQRLIVRGEYMELDYEIDDIIHIITTNPGAPNLIDDTNNLLIWNPDTLISATAISQQLTCPRRVVLTNRLKFPGVSSLPLIIGEIVHNIFQTCFIQDNCTMELMLELLKHNIEVYLLGILSVGDEVHNVTEEVTKQLPYIETWFRTYFKRIPSRNNLIPSGNNDQVMLSTTEVLEVEESIWSPMFGVKGMVDATLEVKLQTPNQASETYLMPLEIKTGKEYITHQAQASLYALLYKDRYEMDINSYLMIYTKDLQTKKYDISKNDLKSLVNLRNRISKYFKGETRDFPPLLKRTTCDFCHVQDTCMTINKLSEGGTAAESGIPPEMYDQITQHLSENTEYRTFYDYWDQLLTSEESISRKASKYLWICTAKQREVEQGLAIGGLEITRIEDMALEDRFYYTFKREHNDNWTSSKITRFDNVLISDESGHFAMGRGIVKHLSADTIVISTRKRIHSASLRLNEKFEGPYSERGECAEQLAGQGPHEIENSSVGTIRPIPGQTFRSALRNQTTYPSRTTFRIDKDEFFEGMGLARYNLINLFLKDGDEKRRRLVVDLQEPRFSTAPLPFSANPSQYNPDQIRAFEKVLSAEDYALILGMPGTGKTTVIAQLIKYLVDNKKTVFLASYTHSAVDNILIKLKEHGIQFLRIGFLSRVHKEIQEYVPGPNIKTRAELQETYLSPPVVASTCLGIGDVAFSLRTQFDYCIIDEASQVSMPTSLGPLRFCNKFVLVGDHLQLPPLVQHPDAKIKAGLSKSLFKILAEKHPQSVVELTYQYRMCYEIMQLSNVLVYENRLKCGSKQVANQCLSIPSPEQVSRFLNPEYKGLPNSWLDTVLNEKNKVLFLNHDQLPALETNLGERIENHTEAELVRQIVDALGVCGVEESRLGVMSFNRAQLRLLHKKLHDKKAIEILTADQYQGRDKDCIIISLVRSNKDKKVGDLVQEWRRINVAITRAKSKLIILGSKATLSSSDTLRTFIELLDDRGWIYDLKPQAEFVYKFPHYASEPLSTYELLKSPLQTTKEYPEKPRIIKSSPILKDIMNNMS